MAEKIIANFSLKGTEKINAVLKIDSPYREHNMLYGRDEEDCHPISAIIGLETALDEKQEVINDLDEIRDGASKGVTAVQPATLNDYALKSKIQELNATDGITLTDGYIYNGGEQTALTIALPTSVNVSFLVEIDFTSGSTPTTLTYPNTIKWSGDDVSNNVFTPVANKRYTMICYYNGVDFVFVTNGVVA